MKNLPLSKFFKLNNQVRIFITISAVIFCHNKINGLLKNSKKTNYFHKNNPAEFLSVFSREEKYFLDFFLREFLFEDAAVYVLFEDKPAAITEYRLFKNSNFNLSSPAFSRKNSLIKKGCEIFRKHYQNRGDGNIILLFCDLPSSVDITLINKKNLLVTIDNHLEEFKRILGDKVTSLSILNEIIKYKRLDEVLKYDECLIGILLGFGKNNAFLYKVMKKERNILPPYKMEKKISSRYKLSPFSQEKNSLAFFPLPAFMADQKDPETKYLKKKYTLQRKSIHKKYANYSFLEVTLSKLLDKN